MIVKKKFTVSHAPYWHDGSTISARSYSIILAALPAIIMGIFQYGAPALAVVSLSISSAMIWELLMNLVSGKKITIGDGNAALIGVIFAMLVPATLPWWAVLTGTFFAVIIGKEIFGGIGSYPFNPVAVTIAILMLSWKDFFDFDQALLNYDFNFIMAYPLAALKHFGISIVDTYSFIDLLMGRQSGGIGSTFGLGLIIGGVYLIAKGIARWEMPVAFLVGIFLTALAFKLADASSYAGPVFHIFTGYTLVGAFFLATEDSSSPVYSVPMLICGATAGVITILIRNVGAYPDGVIFAILVMNLVNPLIDKIRPKAIGKVV